MITADRLFEALEATWPPEGGDLVGPFRLRRGGGGGQRVSAAVWDAAAGTPDAAQAVPALMAAESRMAAWGQRPLFMLRGGVETVLDDLLARRNYRISDPSLLLAAPVGAVASHDLPPLAAFAAPAGLAICREIWSEGGIGAVRQAVISRTPPPVAAILGRHKDDPAGAALVAVDGPVAMIHALHVRPQHRRGGVGRAMVVRAAHWAAARGCETLALAVVADNGPGRALFEGLGMAEVAAYHYRAAPDHAL